MSDGTVLEKLVRERARTGDRLLDRLAALPYVHANEHWVPVLEPAWPTDALSINMQRDRWPFRPYLHLKNDFEDDLTLVLRGGDHLVDGTLYIVAIAHGYRRASDPPEKVQQKKYIVAPGIEVQPEWRITGTSIAFPLAEVLLDPDVASGTLSIYAAIKSSSGFPEVIPEGQSWTTINIDVRKYPAPRVEHVEKGRLRTSRLDKDAAGNYLVHITPVWGAGDGVTRVSMVLAMDDASVFFSRDVPSGERCTFAVRPQFMQAAIAIDATYHARRGTPGPDYTSDFLCAIVEP